LAATSDKQQAPGLKAQASSGKQQAPGGWARKQQAASIKKH